MWEPGCILVLQRLPLTGPCHGRPRSSDAVILPHLADTCATICGGVMQRFVMGSASCCRYLCNGCGQGLWWFQPCVAGTCATAVAWGV